MVRVWLQKATALLPAARGGKGAAPSRNSPTEPGRGLRSVAVKF